MGIDALKDGIVTRGVPIDIPRLGPRPDPESGTHVYREDIEAWEMGAGVRVSPGDERFLGTGRWARSAKLGAAAAGSNGYDACISPVQKGFGMWALLGSDSAQDVGVVPGCKSTAPSPTMCWLPVHKFALVARGITFFQILHLEVLAATAARLKRWEFMLTAAPIRVPGGTGTPKSDSIAVLQDPVRASAGWRWCRRYGGWPRRPWIPSSRVIQWSTASLTELYGGSEKIGTPAALLDAWRTRHSTL